MTEQQIIDFMFGKLDEQFKKKEAGDRTDYDMAYIDGMRGLIQALIKETKK